MVGEQPALVRVRVPAKVNLFLHVGAARPDGYHDLVSILQTVSLYDTLDARLASSGASAHPSARRFMALEFAVNGAGGGAGTGEVPTDERNLAARAARHLMDHLGLGCDGPDGPTPCPVTRLTLSKAIPVAGGMAGGSADAAAALLALNALWDLDLARDELQELAGTLGADVPFCVGGGTALATGTGTATAQVLSRGTFHWVVGVTDAPLATPAVYRAFDELGGADQERAPDAVLQALRTGDADALGAALHNDLEPAALHLMPTLAAKRDAMLEAGALGAIVSGSGPTVVALAADLQHAHRLAEVVAPRFDRVEVAHAPAGGPELVASG